MKVDGFSGNKIGLTFGIEGLCFLCPSPGCNLVPNFSFEQHRPFPASGPIYWGQFAAFADCWENGSSHPSGTPDYAIEPNSVAFGGTPVCIGQGNRCKSWPPAPFQTWPNLTSEHATAHFFVNDTQIPNRREYILTELQNTQGNTTLAVNHYYYVSLRVYNSPTVRFHNDALGIMFTDQHWTEPTNGIYTPPTNFDVLYQSFTGTISNYNNNNWRQYKTLLQNNNTAKSHLVIGNFENNTVTASRNIAANTHVGTIPITDPADRLAAIYLDYVEVIEMPDAGEDITVCAGEPVTLGYVPACLPNGITYQWIDALANTLATSQTLTVTALQGTTQYLLGITFDGITIFSPVTVTGLAPAHLSVSATNQTVCNGNLSFEITDFDPNNITYSFTTTGLTGIGQFDGNGNLDFGSVEFSNPLGMATVTIIANNPLSECQTSQTITVYDCCENQTSGIPVYNDYFTPYNQGTAGQDYIIYGSVTLDDSYTFTDCNFYFQPDAELVTLNDLQIEFQNCTFQSCNTFKWDRIYNEHQSTSLTFTDCQIGEGLRALHTENDAQLSLSGTLLYDNTLSQLAHSYSNGGALSWQTNTYNMYPLNSLTQQHPNSKIPITTILNNGYDVVGIKFDEAQSFILGYDNTFWADCSTISEGYLHVWLTQNSIGDISGNTFNEGMNIYVEQASTATIIDNHFQKSVQTYGGPGGIYANGSTVTVGDLGASSYSNYLLDGAAILIDEPIESYIYKNQITQNILSAAIKISAASLLSSRTLIHENEITAKTCILLQNLKSDWQSSSNQKVYVHDNDLFPTKSSNSTGNSNIVIGVNAANCEGVSIGENTITHVYTTGVTLPDATNNYQSVGILLTNSRNAFVGCNNIFFSGRALAFSGDVTRDSWLNYDPNGSPVFPIQFQSNKFMNYYFGIYIGIGTTTSSIGQNISNKELASDNEWLQVLGLPISSADRIKDDRINQGPGDIINIYYTGATNTSNAKYPDAPNSPFTSADPLPVLKANNCLIAVPSNKTASTLIGATLLIYPNPVEGILNYSIDLDSKQLTTALFDISILGMDGKTHLSVQNVGSAGELEVDALPRGVYIFKAIGGTSVYVQRFVRN